MMHPQADVQQLTSKEEFERAYVVMRQLRPHLTLAGFLELLVPMRSEGYELWALFESDVIKALGGVSVRHNSFYGRHLWIFDLVTAEGERSSGYGSALLGHLEDLARSRGCRAVALSSRSDRADAHRFYQEKMGYHIPSFVFKKDLGPEGPAGR